MDGATLAYILQAGCNSFRPLCHLPAFNITAGSSVRANGVMLQMRPHIKPRQRRWKVVWFRVSSPSLAVPLRSTAGVGDSGDRWGRDRPALLSWSGAWHNTHTAHTHTHTHTHSHSFPRPWKELQCPMRQLPPSDALKSWQPKMTHYLPLPRESFAEIARLRLPVARFAWRVFSVCLWDRAKGICLHLSHAIQQVEV